MAFESLCTCGHNLAAHSRHVNPWDECTECDCGDWTIVPVCSQCGASKTGENAEHENVYECGKGDIFVTRGECPRTKPKEPPPKEPGVCRWCGQGLIVNVYEEEYIVYEDYSESKDGVWEDAHLTHARCCYCGASSPDPRNLIGEFKVTDRNIELILSRVAKAMSDRSSYVEVPPRVAQALIEFWEEHHHVNDR